jgi:hypothetical protein
LVCIGNVFQEVHWEGSPITGLGIPLRSALEVPWQDLVCCTTLLPICSRFTTRSKLPCRASPLDRAETPTVMTWCPPGDIVWCMTGLPRCSISITGGNPPCGVNMLDGAESTVVMARPLQGGAPRRANAAHGMQLSGWGRVCVWVRLGWVALCQVRLIKLCLVGVIRLCSLCMVHMICIHTGLVMLVCPSTCMHDSTQ